MSKKNGGFGILGCDAVKYFRRISVFQKNVSLRSLHVYPEGGEHLQDCIALTHKRPQQERKYESRFMYATEHIKRSS